MSRAHRKIHNIEREIWPRLVEHVARPLQSEKIGRQVYRYVLPHDYQIIVRKIDSGKWQAHLEEKHDGKWRITGDYRDLAFIVNAQDKQTALNLLTGWMRRDIDGRKPRAVEPPQPQYAAGRPTGVYPSGLDQVPGESLEHKTVYWTVETIRAFYLWRAIRTGIPPTTRRLSLEEKLALKGVVEHGTLIEEERIARFQLSKLPKEYIEPAPESDPKELDFMPHSRYSKGRAHSTFWNGHEQQRDHSDKNRPEVYQREESE